MSTKVKQPNANRHPPDASVPGVLSLCAGDAIDGLAAGWSQLTVSSGAVAPTTQNDGEVHRIDNAVIVNIGLEWTSTRAPRAEDRCEIDTVDNAVFDDITVAHGTTNSRFAAVWHPVLVPIHELAPQDLAVVDDAITVAVS